MTTALQTYDEPPKSLEEAIERHRNKGGRPVTYTFEKAAAVLMRIAAGETTEDACTAEGTPVSTWYYWRSEQPGLLEAILRASELQAAAQVDQADKMLREVEVEGGDPRLANARLRKAQQIADFRFRLAQCRDFKTFGDKKAQLNINLNAQVADGDASKWFNR